MLLKYKKFNIMLMYKKRFVYFLFIYLFSVEKMWFYCINSFNKFFY